MRYSIPSYKTVAVEYAELRGVDLSSDVRQVSKSRSVRCKNMYKKYSAGGSFVETRPGFRLLGNFTSRINGVHFCNISGSEKVLVHAGTKLYYWSTFPAAPATLTSLYTMADKKSVSFCLGNMLYILDGSHYLCYNGSTVSAVAGYVPTTSITRTPLGGGESYQAVNLLSDSRINSFRGDGSSTQYQLDTTNIDLVQWVKVNGVTTNAYTVDRVAGTVTFNTAPSVPDLGLDNVVIQYKKAVGGYNKIANCTIAREFDNRIFLSGNSDYKNILYHSELNNPTYFPDINTYADGSEYYPITALAVQDNRILVFKNTDKGSLYYHTPTLDYDLGRVYPTVESAVNRGCVAVNGAVCFKDDLVYLSPLGLEGLGISAPNSAGCLNHRSTLVDGELLKTDLANCLLGQWQGYLCLTQGNKMFLADSRSIYASNGSFEYEWFLWTDLTTAGGNLYNLFTHSDNLYFGTDNGRICIFDDVQTDNGVSFESLFETRAECAGAISVKKSVSKPGCNILLKKIPNSRLSVYYKTENGSETWVADINSGGLDFSNLNFQALSFTTGEDNLSVLPIRVKGYKTLSIILKSNTRFGVGFIGYNAQLHGYIK